MKKSNPIELDFIVDKLTNSIENVLTGDVFPTNITLLTRTELKSVLKKNGWQFDWRFELKQPEREVYKLTIPHAISVVHGLISIEIRDDHVYMHLVESAPSTKGNQKFMQEFLETSLLLLADFHFNVGLQETFLSFQKHN